MAVTSQALIVCLPACITARQDMFDPFAPLPVDKFPDKLCPTAPSNMPKNPTFLSFCYILNSFTNVFYQ